MVAEGSDGQYRVVLNKAASRSMTFQVVVSDGTAHRIGDVAGKDAQDIMWTGHYILRTTWYFLGIPVRSSDQIIYDRVANGTGGGDRPMVGPKEVNWDFTLYQNGAALNTNVVTVTVAAGQTTSDSFTLRAWREKVTIDLFQDNTGHIEGTESFSMSAGGQCQLNGSITDTSEYPTVSPLTLDLDGNGIRTTPVTSTSPLFDLFGAGHKVRSGWTSDALLAYDANGNGRVDNGGELFGGLRGEGYQELARFDTNRNGKIDSGDRRFSKLSVWVDADQDRVTDAGELRSLSAAGVASISLKNHWSGARQNGNTFGETGTATATDGHAIKVVDLYFPIRD